MGGHDTVTGVNNIQYQAQFGNGVSATIGLELSEPDYWRTQEANLGFAIGADGCCDEWIGGAAAPDIVGNIRRRSGLGSLPVVGRASREPRELL